MYIYIYIYISYSADLVTAGHTYGLELTRNPSTRGLNLSQTANGNVAEPGVEPSTSCVNAWGPNHCSEKVGCDLAFTRYCHRQYCIVYGIHEGIRVGSCIAQ